MKKFLTLTLAILFCINAFAASSIKYTDISIGMSKSEFCLLFNKPIKKDNIVTADENFESFGICHFVAFFSEDALTNVSICLNNCLPADFKKFDKLFDQATAIVCTEASLKPVGEPVESFTAPFAQGDGHEFEALCLGFYKRSAEFGNLSTLATITSGAQGIITIATYQNILAEQEPALDFGPDFADNDSIAVPIADPTIADSPAANAEEQPTPQWPSPEKPTSSANKLALYFEGLPVTGSAADFANQLAEAYPSRITIANASNPEQIFLKGTIDGLKDCEIYISNGSNNLINSITVYYPAHTGWTPLQKQYFDIKSIYDAQNFVIEQDLHSWENGYSYQDHEMEGVRNDKCWYLTKYRINNRHSATLFISKYARVALYYEVSQQAPFTFPGGNIYKTPSTLPSN